MQPFREKNTDSPKEFQRYLLSPGLTQLWVSMATVPCLGLLIAGRTLTYGLTQFGMASEEVFRGIQLPTLDPADQQHS